MKKFVALLMVIMMFVVVFVGCGDTGGQTEESSNSDSTVQDKDGDASSEDQIEGNADVTGEGSEGNEQWTGEVSNVVMTYLTLGTTPGDLEKVQEKVNEISVKKVGVEVELRPISAFDAFSQFPLFIGTGERIDLMMPLMQDLNTYVSQGLILPVDEYIDSSAPNIKRLSADYPLTSSNIVDGKTYAIMPVANTYGSGGSYQLAKRYLDSVDFDYDPDRIYSLDDLTNLFEMLKTAYPDMYPAGVVASGRTTTEFLYYGGVYDMLGATTSSGVLMGTDGKTVVNLYETDEYYNYLMYLRNWYQAGYIHPDAATTGSTMTSLLMSNVFNGYFMVSNPIQKNEPGGYFGDDEGIMLRLAEPFYGSTSRGGWVVPMTSEEPEAALRFLDLVWSDSEVSNLIQWGIEGEHYVMVDDSIGLIDFPEGMDAATSGYYNSLGLYGDTREVYIWSPNNSPELNRAYMDEALANQTQGVGFVYDPTAMAPKITAIQAVISQYLPSLESGSVDIDKYYPAFMQALEEVGIDEVIADKQAQFDSWRAQN